MDDNYCFGLKILESQLEHQESLIMKLEKEMHKLRLERGIIQNRIKLIKLDNPEVEHHDN